MTFKENLDLNLWTMLRSDFDTRRGYTVPTTDTVKLSDGAVRLDAVYMYSDLANSSVLARDHPEEDAAKVVRAFLQTVTQVMKRHDGEIRSFDGDRVMAIYVGDGAPSKAAKAALEIKWLVDNVVQELITDRLESVRESGWVMSHGTGIANGEAFIVRGGVRGANDLVSIGNPPNIAAKLSEKREHRTWITDDMWNAMDYATCISSKGKPMWSLPETMGAGERIVKARYSDWGWVVN